MPRPRSAPLLALASCAALAALAGTAGARAPQTEISQPAAPERRPGTPAPDFELPTEGGGVFRLSQASAEGYVLLVFIRGTW